MLRYFSEPKYNTIPDILPFFLSKRLSTRIILFAGGFVLVIGKQKAY